MNREGRVLFHEIMPHICHFVTSDTNVHAYARSALISALDWLRSKRLKNHSTNSVRALSDKLML